MFVVRIQNDEAVLFRAFRHLASARRWAVERNAEDAQNLFDIFDASGAPDAPAAVKSARSGEALLVQRVESIAIPAFLIASGSSAAEVPGDHAFV